MCVRGPSAAKNPIVVVVCTQQRALSVPEILQKIEAFFFLAQSLYTVERKKSALARKVRARLGATKEASKSFTDIRVHAAHITNSGGEKMGGEKEEKMSA